MAYKNVSFKDLMKCISISNYLVSDFGLCLDAIRSIAIKMQYDCICLVFVTQSGHHQFYLLISIHFISEPKLIMASGGKSLIHICNNGQESESYQESG